MGNLLKKSALLLCCSLGISQLQAQLVVNGGTLTINSNAFISVQGNMTSNVDIQGTGKIVMSGSTAQQLNSNGFAIPNLEINTTGAGEVQLVGNSKVTSNLNFVNGKIKTGNFNLVLANTATSTGQGTTKFVWTNGTGQLQKMLTADVTDFELPVGENGNYRPAYLTSTGGSYSGALVGVRSATGASANKPPMIANTINAFWAVSRAGITGGTVRLAGQYTDADVAGNEAVLAGYYFNGTDWSSASETHDNATNRISTIITGATGEVSAMNKFIATGARAFLQGANYSSSTGLMSDALRAGTNIIPLTDPYRSLTGFTHVQNTSVETVSPSVFAAQALEANNIVDWVFLELRNTNASPGNIVLQTRSALLQRDGDIVDVDGISPVTFNNVTNGTYGISVRHRNHLGLAFNPSTSGRNFTEAKSVAYTTNVADFRTAPQAQLFGTAAAHTASTHPTLGSVNLLWGGNANSNANVRYNALANDKDVIYNNRLVPSNTYHVADINMNRNVRFGGLQNDKDFLYNNVLATSTSTIRNQALPN